MNYKTNTKKKCFVISPIGKEGSKIRKHSDLVLNYIIRPVLEDDLSYTLKRADELSKAGMINDHAINYILESELAIALLTFVNPNVFYELGLRHMIKKPVIHIAAENTTLPFDNAGYRTIRYDIEDWNTHVKAREQLKNYIEEILMDEENNIEVSNPVTHAIANNNSSSHDKEKATANQLLSQLEILHGRILNMIASGEKGNIEELLTNLDYFRGHIRKKCKTEASEYTRGKYGDAINLIDRAFDEVARLH